MEKTIDNYWKTPKGRYIRQRANAITRGIPWEFTFETWWHKWEKSGHWEKRGNFKGAYYMCRVGDVGPYSPINTVIKSASANAQEAWDLRKARENAPKRDPFRLTERTSAWDYEYTCKNT